MRYQLETFVVVAVGLIVLCCSLAEPATAQQDEPPHGPIVDATTSLAGNAAGHPAPGSAGQPSTDIEQQPLANAVQVEPGTPCLTAKGVVGHTRMWLGRRAVSADIRVRIAVDPMGRDGLFFEVARKTGVTRRNFYQLHDSCDALHALVGLAVAMAIEPLALDGLHRPPPSPPPTTAPQTTPPVQRLEEVRTARLSISPSLAGELLPGLSLGLVGGLEIPVWPWLGTKVDILVHHARDQRLPGSAGRFSTTLAAGTVQLCAGGHALDGLRLAVCLGPAAGAVQARGHGYQDNRTASGPWLAVVAGLRLEVGTDFLWALDLNVISGLNRPTVQARAVDAAAGAYTRRLSATGLMVSIGPAFGL